MVLAPSAAMIRNVTLLLLLAAAPVPAFAQASPGKSATMPTLPSGRLVWILDLQGHEISGKVVDQSSTTIDVRTSGGERSVRVNDIATIRQKDSNWDGVGKGFVGGSLAMLGVGWIMNRQHREPSDLVVYALLGAGGAIGGWIDDAIEHRVTVFDRAGASGTTVTIGPIVGWGDSTRVGIGGHITWR